MIRALFFVSSLWLVFIALNACAVNIIMGEGYDRYILTSSFNSDNPYAPTEIITFDLQPYKPGENQEVVVYSDIRVMWMVLESSLASDIQNSGQAYTKLNQDRDRGFHVMALLLLTYYAGQSRLTLSHIKIKRLSNKDAPRFWYRAKSIKSAYKGKHRLTFLADFDKTHWNAFIKISRNGQIVFEKKFRVTARCQESSTFTGTEQASVKREKTLWEKFCNYLYKRRSID